MKSNAQVRRWPCGEEQEDREAAHGAAAEEWERGTDGRAKEAVRRAMRLLVSREPFRAGAAGAAGSGKAIVPGRDRKRRWNM